MLKAIEVLDSLPINKEFNIEKRILLRTTLEALDLVKENFTVGVFKDKNTTYYFITNLNGWSKELTEDQYNIYKEIFKHE